MGLAVWQLAAKAGLPDTTGVPLVAGVMCMVILYFAVPKPMWVYVFGHEFTHALAAMSCGGRVKGMKVTAGGGHVLVTKDNFFITLAPYFVPIYTGGIIAGFLLARHFLGWNGPWAWGAFCWALGLTYAFHVLLTLNILRTRQPDITSQGVFFSVAIIAAGNLLAILAALPLLMPAVGWTAVGTEVLASIWQILQAFGGWTAAAWNLVS
jgi:hypothetical protein